MRVHLIVPAFVMFPSYFHFVYDFFPDNSKNVFGMVCMFLLLESMHFNDLILKISGNSHQCHIIFSYISHNKTLKDYLFP